MKTSMEAEFWEGQIIELQTDDGEIYQTQIIAKDTEYFYIQRPISQSKILMPIKHEMLVSAYFHNHVQGLCKFRSRIYTDQHRLAISAPLDNAVQKAQRRHYLRVPVELDMVMTISSTDNNESISMPCRTRDISGGGLSISSAWRIEPGQIVNGNVELHLKHSHKNIPFSAKVVYCEKLKDAEFKISLEFRHLKESLRSEIVKYCLHKQIELRNKLKNYSV